jgi:hypothetical protein
MPSGNFPPINPQAIVNFQSFGDVFAVETSNGQILFAPPAVADEIDKLHPLGDWLSL